MERWLFMPDALHESPTHAAALGRWRNALGGVPVSGFSTHSRNHPRTFVWISSMQKNRICRHVVKIHLQMKHICPLCDAVFSRKQTLHTSPHSCQGKTLKLVIEPYTWSECFKTIACHGGKGDNNCHSQYENICNTHANRYSRFLTCFRMKSPLLNFLCLFLSVDQFIHILFITLQLQ